MPYTTWTTGNNATHHGRRKLDGELCFSLWCSGNNSYNDVATKLYRDGVTTDQGLRFSRDAVYKAAWRWAFRNPTIAKQYVEEKHRANCSTFVEAQWWYDYVAHLYAICSSHATRKLIEIHALEDVERDFLTYTGKQKKIARVGRWVSRQVC